jgi:hypothetical protein
MTSRFKHSPPSEPPARDDASEEEESTAIRSRPQPVPTRRRRFQSGVWQSASADRTERLEHKLRAARALLASLPPDHPRARLLRIALVRRDEVVLDGILLALGVPPR